MASNALGTDAPGPAAELLTWLERVLPGNGASRELDRRVIDARRALAAADDRTGMTEVAARLAEWGGGGDDALLASAALMHASELAEDAGDADGACDYCEWALRHTPTDPAPLSKLDRLLRQRGDLARLEVARATHLELLSERAPFELGMRVQALVALGELRANHLSDLDSAIDAYQQALELEPAEATLTALAELYLRRDQPGDADDAAELYFRLAELADPEAARAYLEMALDIQPDHEGALASLQKLTEDTGGADEDAQLVSRMLAFASVAPASDRRDSVLEELKRRHTDVSALEPEPSVAVSPQELGPSPWDVPTVVPGVTAASAPTPTQATASGAPSLSSTQPYQFALPHRPSSGVGVMGRAGAASPPPADVDESPRTGETLPLRPQAPGSFPEVATSPETARARPPAVSGRPGIARVFESGPPPGAYGRSWLPWVGAGGLAVLALLAWVGIGAPSRGERPMAKAPQPAAATSQTGPAEPGVRPPPTAPPLPAGRPASDAPAAASPPRRVQDGPASQPPEAEPARSARPREPASTPAPTVESARNIGGVSLPVALLRLDGGELSQAVLLERLLSPQRKLARCYRALRRKSPDASGLLEFGFRVSPRGRVSHVRALSGSLGAQGVKLCGIRGLRATRFPAPTGGAVEVRTVFDFAPPGR